MKNLMLCAIALLGLLCLTGNVNGQNAGTLDLSFDPVLPLDYTLPAASTTLGGTCCAIGTGNNTDKIFAGFKVSNTSINKLLRYSLDGTFTAQDVNYNAAFHAFWSQSGQVNEIEPERDANGDLTGRIYVGTFKQGVNNNVEVVNLIDANGANVTSFNCPAFASNNQNNSCTMLYHDFDNDVLIYAVKDILAAGAITLMAVDPLSGATLASRVFSGVVCTGANKGIFSISKIPGAGSTSYVLAGGFSIANGTNFYNGLMQMNLFDVDSDGDLDWVQDLTQFADNTAACQTFADAILLENIDSSPLTMYVGGRFTSIRDDINHTWVTGHNSLARYDFIANQWTLQTTFQSGVIGILSSITDLCSYNCNIIACGHFTHAIDATTQSVYPGIAAWSFDGDVNTTDFQPFASWQDGLFAETSGNGTISISDIEIQTELINDGDNNWEIIAVGGFNRYDNNGTQLRNNVARLNGMDVIPANANFTVNSDSNGSSALVTGVNLGTWTVEEAPYGTFNWTPASGGTYTSPFNLADDNDGSNDWFRVTHTVSSGCGSSCGSVESIFGFASANCGNGSPTNTAVALRSTESEEDPTSYTFQKNDELLVYPNPSDETFIIKGNFEPNKMVTLTVYDMMGKHILTQQINSFNPNGEELNMQKYAPGTYLVSVTQGEIRLNESIIKN